MSDVTQAWQGDIGKVLFLYVWQFVLLFVWRFVLLFVWMDVWLFVWRALCPNVCLVSY